MRNTVELVEMEGIAALRNPVDVFSIVSGLQTGLSARVVLGFDS